MTATSEIPVPSEAPANRPAASLESPVEHSPAAPSPAVSASFLESLAPLDDRDRDASGNRSFVITWLLSLLLGFLGLDRFYTGRYRTGALKLVSLGGLGIWWIIDLGIVLAGGLRCGRGPLRGFAQDKEIAWIATGFTLIVAYSLQVDELVGALLTTLF
ncbi:MULTISPECIES: TM2 domain-containing protein [unclassified Brevibacterium]|uniref:TM2 domain-containing protein n=1 Tax=unclassified Brevibacterium TaxID=2614124 RepID=UPI0010928A83|nr:TM2 domain-containing protein [Brevibacterium sp. S22]TGD31600.1 TM2 domain-containing protein [Brevibacterium sp. S22]